MSKLSDLRAICADIANYEIGLQHVCIDKSEYVVGPLGAMTAGCFIYCRKMRDEYRLDYDSVLIASEKDDPSFDDLEKSLRDNWFVWKHNVYRTDFFDYTFTAGKLPKDKLKQRISSFLLEHSKPRPEARRLVEGAHSDVLKAIREFRPEDYQSRLVEILGQ